MNSNIKNWNSTQKFFQMSVMCLDTPFDGDISLACDGLEFALVVTRGLVNQITMSNGTRSRTWFFRWMGGGRSNEALHEWMFDTLKLWDALDGQDDLDEDTGEKLLDGERAWVDPDCDDRIDINDSHWNSGDGLCHTGERIEDLD